METNARTVITLNNNTTATPLVGVINWDTAFVDYDIEMQRDHSGLRCGVKELDNIFRLDRSQLVTFTGVKGNGKSTFVTYYSTLLCKKYGLKCAYFDFEAPSFRTIDKLLHYYDNDCTQLKNHALIVDNNLNKIENIIKLLDSLKNEADIAVIDPFLSLNFGGQVDTYSIGEVLDNLRQCAIRNNIIIMLVAHSNGQIEFLDDNEFPRSKNICGSSNFGNISDAVIGIRRLPNDIELIGVDKLRYNGDMGRVDSYVKMQFDPTNKTYKTINKAKMTAIQEQRKAILMKDFKKNN